MIARPAIELAMSAQQRPATTAEGAIGIERKRSITPRSTSVATTVIVLPIPKAIVMTNSPGIRNSR